MFSIDVRGLPELQAALRNLASEQMPFAMMTAINTTAFKVKAALQQEMRSVFDRPTPWLIRQVAVAKATKQNLTAIVGTPEGIKDQYGNNAGFSRATSSGVFERVLSPNIVGGSRRLKAAEHRLQKAGILPVGWFTVPAQDAPLDRYGNLPGSWWMMLLSWLNAAQWSSQGAIQNRAEKISKRKNKLQRAGIEMFAVVPGKTRSQHLRPGIYLHQRKGGVNAIKALLLFVPRVNYRPRLNWAGVAQRTVNAELPIAAAAAVQRAMDTAK
jgi:hypothetical protein